MSPNYPNLVDKLNANGVKITAEPTDRSMHPILSMLIILVSYVIINRGLDFFYAPNARRWGQGNGFWKVKS